MATSNQRQTIQEYYTEMAEHGEVQRVKAFKSVVFGGIIFGLAWLAIQNGADPQPVFLTAAVSALLLAGVEFGELRVLKSLTNVRITFQKQDDEE
jgi:hypothetical protein